MKCILLITLMLALAPSPARADEGADAGKLAPLARFVGEWKLDANWSDGTPLRARVEYEWGLEKRILKGRTFVIDDAGRERQRYEDVMAWDARRDSIVDVNFSVDGAVNELIVEPKDAHTLLWGWKPYDEGKEARVRQTIRFDGADRFVWIVELKGESGWGRIVEGTWVKVRRAGR